MNLQVAVVSVSRSRCRSPRRWHGRRTVDLLMLDDRRAVPAGLV